MSCRIGPRSRNLPFHTKEYIPAVELNSENSFPKAGADAQSLGFGLIQVAGEIDPDIPVRLQASSRASSLRTSGP